MSTDDGKDVHTEHCCVVHGCKYGYDHFDCGKTCTVAAKLKPQSYPCEQCTGGAYHEPEPWRVTRAVEIAAHWLGDKPETLTKALWCFLGYAQEGEIVQAERCLRHVVPEMGLPREVALLGFERGHC